LALYEILGFPDWRTVGALSLDKLDTLYRPARTMVGHHVDSRAMTVALMEHKRVETAEMMTPWLSMPLFTLLQGAEICGKLEDASNCCRWIRPYFFVVQNTIHAALLDKGERIRGYYKRLGIEKAKAAYALPKHMEQRLAPLIARDMAKLLWHSKATFAVPEEVRQMMALLQKWLRDPTVKWEKSIAHWVSPNRMSTAPIPTWPLSVIFVGWDSMTVSVSVNGHSPTVTQSWTIPNSTAAATPWLSASATSNF
jgi:hypothetical protein